ncbi:probable galactinol--sucrose galactosyltransferase 2 [Tanacetum coccineum]
MTITPKISIDGDNLVVNGKTVLTGVPENIVLTPGTGSGLVTGAFIGASATDSKSLHVFPVGVLEGLRIMCCFRFKLWWMTQRMGTCGKDIPLETQFMLLECKDNNEGPNDNSPTIYAVFLPLLEGQFRAVLQGNEKNELEICLESGDQAVETNQGLNLVYMNAGTNPFEVITQAVKAVENHMQTFHHREKKKLPGVLDWFGWCTWDAFYTDVTAEGVEKGIKSLSEGGTSPRFLIIDDGWQQIGNENKDTNVVVQEGAKLNMLDDENPVGMCVKGNQPDIVMDSLSVHGLGLVHPRKVFNFYNELHAYLASCEVDGVKVDVQNIIETLGAGHGGRVLLTRSYVQALEASIAKNFKDNGCIACMCHNTDGLYSAKQTAIIRASDDFYPHDPVSHTILISSVAYTTLFLGEFMQPDWDMFHSLHPAADYHAAARSIGGCPIYVSDKPGNHNFDLLKKLVLPDGSVLCAQLNGRPTLDCLFADLARDGISLLKVWNVNKCTGVVSVFNCQGASWCKIEKKTRIHGESPGVLTGFVQSTDVDALAQVAGQDWHGETIILVNVAGEIVQLPKGVSLPVTLKVLEYELFHFCPLKEISENISVTPIGLLDMFNSGGAVEQFEVQKTSKSEVNGDQATPFSENQPVSATVSIKVRGYGRFGAYSSQRLLKCTIDGNDDEFNYDGSSGLVTLVVPVPREEMYK